jgi:hypothetical protein
MHPSEVPVYNTVSSRCREIVKILESIRNITDLSEIRLSTDKNQPERSHQTQLRPVIKFFALDVVDDIAIRIEP